MRKNIVSIVLCFVILTFSICPISYASEEPIHIAVNGVEVKFDFQKPVIIDKQTFVSYKEVFAKLGYDSTWNANENSITVSEYGFALKATIGSNKLIKITYNKGKKKEKTTIMTAIPCIINNRAMVPLGAFLKELGIKMKWDTESNTINITSDRVTESTSSDGIIYYDEFPNLPSFKNIVNVDPASVQTSGNSVVYSYSAGYLTDNEFAKYAQLLQNYDFGMMGDSASAVGGLTLQNKGYKITITYNPNDGNLKEAVYIITISQNSI